jgi:hypothetical protein
MTANLNLSPDNNAMRSALSNQLSKLLEYKILPSKEDIYSVIRFNGKTLDETDDVEQKQIIKEIIEKIKEINLTDKLFALPNPVFNIINTALRPWIVEFDCRNIMDEMFNRLSDIYLKVKTSL